MKVFNPALCPPNIAAELTMYMAIEGARLNLPYGSPAYHRLTNYHADELLILDDPDIERVMTADTFLQAMITEEQVSICACGYKQGHPGLCQERF